ncbi:hypothetical protein CJF31_00007143 [Rutstroemia sp. NJR-2017a BVV2]|nr:hypothetical protein CJF31_00007143 [Rutstroemia sp. NJR-2017a BVV2]
MDSIDIVPGFLSINSGVLMLLAFLIIISVLYKIWVEVRKLPAATAREMEMRRAADWV